jgi:uncharacterized membrane protein
MSRGASAVPPPERPPTHDAPDDLGEHTAYGVRVRRSWVFFVASAVVYDLVWVWQAVMLPQRVPRHWGAAGAPDRFGSRTEALSQSALLGLGLLGLFIVLGWAVTQAPLERLRVPALQEWSRPERRDLRRALMEDLWVLGILTLLAVAVREVVMLPDLRSPSTGVTVLALFLLWLTVVVAWCVGAYRSRYARPVTSPAKRPDPKAARPPR